MDIVKVNEPDPGKKTVCIIAEGSYPYVTGGVSAWIQDILSGCTGYNFIVYAIVAEEGQEVRYKFPPGVTHFVTQNLTEQPAPARRRKIRKEFFADTMEFHAKMKLERDISLMEGVAGEIRTKGYSQAPVFHHMETWKILCEHNTTSNPLYPFADYFWAWRASHAYLINILSWDIPVADVYHPISTGYAGYVAAIAKMIYKRPVILTEHGLYNKEREMDIKRSQWVRGYQRDIWINVFNSLSRIAYNYSDLIISLFEHNRGIQVEQGAAEERTRVIPNGIEIDRYLDLKKESRDGFSVGIIARVVPIKDVKTFIIAAKIVSEKVPGSMFYVIGPSDEDERYFGECRRLVENFKLEERVVFTGQADVREYYRFLDVVVLSSIREAQPLVIIEAYCAGIPVVSTRVGNVPEMLDYDENLLADPKDPEKIASGIVKLYRDTEYRETLVRNNREKAVKFYSKRDLIRQYDAIYASFIEKYDSPAKQE